MPTLQFPWVNYRAAVRQRTIFGMAGDDGQIVVFADARPALADMVRNRLAEAGINAFLDNTMLQQSTNDLPLSVLAPRVVVAEADADAAREIVAEFTREARQPLLDVESSAVGSAGGTADRDDDARSAVGAAIAEGGAAAAVACPQCQRKRMTVCPYCHTASADFPQAYQQPGAADEGPELLLCPTCDEPFEPVYLRRCEWCGHDFGEGLELEQREVVEYLNDRVIAATMLLAVVVVVILAYFTAVLK